MEQVFLAGCDAYDFDRIKRAVDLQFEALRLDALVRPGCNAVIKPNLVMRSGPDAAVATHPLVTAAVGRRLQELGASVTIAESSGGPYTPSALRGVFSACGYTRMAEEYGFALNTDCSHREVGAPDGKRSKAFQVISPILDADLVVDIAKLKSHCMTGMSGAVKNMFGVVPGLMKPELHCRFPEKDRFSEMLVDLCETVRPAVSIVDGVTAMEGNGPTGGSPRFVGALIAGVNPYCVDMVCAELMAMDPAEILMLKNAMERGLCPKDPGEIRVLGEEPRSFRVPDFKQPESKSSNFINYLPKFLRPAAAKLATPVPKIREKDCVGCGKCAESCPQHTIRVVGGKARIDYSNCIRCYCCHEMCPARAVDIRRFSLFRF